MNSSPNLGGMQVDLCEKVWQVAMDDAVAEKAFPPSPGYIVVIVTSSDSNKILCANSFLVSVERPADVRNVVQSHLTYSLFIPRILSSNFEKI